MLTWQCVYNDTAYHVRHILIFPAATLQWTPNDNTTVHFLYRSAQWTEFVLYLYNHPTPPTPNRWDQVRYCNVRNDLLKLYKAFEISSALPPLKLIVFSLCQSPLLMVALEKTSFLRFSKIYETDFFKLYVFASLPIFITHVCYYQPPL